MIFQNIMNEYLQFVKMKKKLNTYLTIERRFKKHIYPFFKNMSIDQIKPKDYLNWQFEIEKHNFKYNYKSALHYTFCDFFKYCSTFYEIENISKKVGNFTNDNVSETIGNIWCINEFKKFISCVDNKKYKLLFTLLFFTGIRKGEALALKWDDIDFTNKTLNINKTITRNHILVTPKTKTSKRIISLDKITLQMLKNYKKNKTCEFIFDDITFSTLLRKKNYFCKKANVKQIKIHEFRHSHACLLYLNNVPIDEISHRLGHSKISITTDTYLKYLPIKEKRVISTLNSIHCF